jgi:uncharacterized protein
MIRPLKLLVLQATKLCNLDCSYCYLPNRHIAGNMEEAVIEAVCTNLLRSEYVGSEVSICLHGGEPLAAGVEWFRRCVQIVDNHAPEGLRVVWSLQTNGTLISDEWVSLFQQHSVEVGVSLDGPRDIHDRARKNWSAEGSFAKSIAGVHKLKERGIPFSVLTVLRESSLSQADDIFHFFSDLGPNEVAFNVEETEAAHVGGTLDKIAAKAASRNFFKRYWDLSAEHGFPHEVREFRKIGMIMEGVLAGQRVLNEVAEPVCCVTVATNGDFCTFAPELLEPSSATKDRSLAVIGNVLFDDVDDALHSDGFRALSDEIAAGVSDCEASCFYFPFCGGGSPSNKFFELGSFRGTETFYCRNSVQSVVDEALERISAVLLQSDENGRPGSHSQ